MSTPEEELRLKEDLLRKGIVEDRPRASANGGSVSLIGCLKRTVSLERIFRAREELKVKEKNRGKNKDEEPCILGEGSVTKEEAFKRVERKVKEFLEIEKDEL